MHTWRERVWASHLVKRSAVKRRLNHLYRTVLLGLCLPLANYLVSFSTLNLPWYTSLGVHGPPPPPSAKMDIKGKVSGKSKTHYGLALFPDFWPQGNFLHMCSVSFKGEWSTLNFTQSFPLFVLATTYLKVFIRDKHWLFTLFLLLLPFWRENRRLIVNVLTRAYLSLISENAGSFKYPAWSPLLCATWKVNRRPVVNI